MSDDKHNTMALRRHELLRDVEDCARATAADQGVESSLAQQVGAAVADMLLERWAGQQITYPMNGYYGLSPRELAIVAARDRGMRIYEIAREWHMSERGVRKLLRRADDGRVRASAQMSLFDTPPAKPPSAAC